MGGGGSWYTWPEKKNIQDVLRDTQTAQARTDYEANVNHFLQSLLKEYNDRKTEEIQQHLDTVKKALEKDIEGAVDLLFGGSISKNTYVNGLSDVDTLVIINRTSLRGDSPGDVKQYFAKRLRERLPNTEVTVGKLAVTVRFSSTGHEIQLLPAISTKTGVRIPGPEREQWSPVIHPIKFAEKLTKINRSCGSKVVPVIKLFKGMMASIPESQQLSGYHIESLAIEAFKNYDGRKTYKDMLQHLCKTASKLVLSRIRDSTGQSLYVDEYLGNDGSHDRLLASAALERLSNRLSRADAHLNVERWKGLFYE